MAPRVSQQRRRHEEEEGERGRKGARRRAQPSFKSPPGDGDRLASALAPGHPAVPMAPALALLALLAPGLVVVALPACDYPAHLWCSSREIAVACQVRAHGAGARAAAPQGCGGSPVLGDQSHRNGTHGRLCTQRC